MPETVCSDALGAVGAKAKPFEFLETEPFETEYGVSGMVRQRRQEFEPTANRLNLIGTILCIVSVLPLFAAMCLSHSDLTYIVAVCLLLGFVALACLALVYAGTRTGAMEKLLEEGDYTRQRKAKSRLVSTVSVCYWLVVTAVFLFYTFGPLGDQLDDLLGTSARRSGSVDGSCNLCLLLSFFHAGIWRHQRRSGRAFSAELRAECGAGAGGDAVGRYVPAIFEFLSEENQNDFYNWRQGTRKDSVCDEIVGKTYFGTKENKRLIHRSESIGKSRSV